MNLGSGAVGTASLHAIANGSNLAESLEGACPSAPRIGMEILLVQYNPGLGHRGVFGGSYGGCEGEGVSQHGSFGLFPAAKLRFSTA